MLLTLFIAIVTFAMLYEVWKNSDNNRNVMLFFSITSGTGLLVRLGASYVTGAILSIAVSVVVLLMGLSRDKNKATANSDISAISMENPQVAALVDEVVRVCNDMFEAGHGMQRFSTSDYEGRIIFVVDTAIKADNQYHAVIFMHDVGNPQKAYGRYNYLACDKFYRDKYDHYDWYLQEYQSCYVPSENHYCYTTRASVIMKKRNDNAKKKLETVLDEAILARCPLAVRRGERFFYTKDVAHW